MSLKLFPHSGLALLTTLLAVTTQAAVSLPDLFSDGMVLQRAQDVPVWGQANPGEAVSVQLGNIASAQTQADEQGNWKVLLDLSASDKGPYTMSVRGENEITIGNVATGQVWLASGQSNMGFALRRTDSAKQEVEAGAGPWVREFKVQRNPATLPQSEVKGKWVAAEPGQTGNFSAVAYFFAKRLNIELEQPIGIIESSWGGTPSEAWTSAEALASDADLARAQQDRNTTEQHHPQLKADFARDFYNWLSKYDLKDIATPDVAEFAAQNIDSSQWQPVRYSNAITAQDLPDRGTFWLRRTVNIPASVAGKNIVLQIPQGRGLPTFYWNGTRFSGPQQWTAEEISKLEGYSHRMDLQIPADLVKEGENVLAIRLYSPLETPGNGGWLCILRGPGMEINLAGNSQWYARAEKTFTRSKTARSEAPAPVAAPPAPYLQPARLYNGMIEPLAPYRLAGVIWYQGESNTGRAWQYRTAFPLLIEDWRRLWNEPQLPFYFCQLANHLPKVDAPSESVWAELREAQTLALRLPHTGQAVLIDIGEAADVHPRNKLDVGNRLALLALRDTYGKQGLIAEGPVFEKIDIAGDKATLTFRNDGKGSELVAAELPETYSVTSLSNTTRPLTALSPGSPLQGFAICGADGKWVWAQARIDGEHSVVVWSPQVAQPVAVRYAWANNPTCNLFNQSGLPATPFRTDDFALSTLDKRF